MDVQKITFVTDLGGGETRAYRFVALLARRLGALLQLVHVVEMGGRCLRRAEARMNRAVRREAAFRGVRVQTITLGGRDLYGLLADFTRDARLVACAHSDVGTSPFGGERILPERLAAECDAPLLVLPRDHAPASRVDARGPCRVLVPHDLLETPDAYMDVCAILGRTETRISSYFYRRPETAPDGSEGHGLEGARDPAREDEDDSVHVLLGSGPTGRELVKSARTLDVHLVVLCPDSDRAAGLSSDDVTWVLRHAPCGVLVVKAPAAHASTPSVEAGYELYCG